MVKKKTFELDKSPPDSGIGDPDAFLIEGIIKAIAPPLIRYLRQKIQAWRGKNLDQEEKPKSDQESFREAHNNWWRSKVDAFADQIPHLPLPELPEGMTDEAFRKIIEEFFNDPANRSRIIAIANWNNDCTDDWGIFGYRPMFVYLEGVNREGAYREQTISVHNLIDNKLRFLQDPNSGFLFLAEKYLFPVNAFDFDAFENHDLLQDPEVLDTRGLSEEQAARVRQRVRRRKIIFPILKKILEDEGKTEFTSEDIFRRLQALFEDFQRQDTTQPIGQIENRGDEL